jgi:hypothetical protein
VPIDNLFYVEGDQRRISIDRVLAWSLWRRARKVRQSSNSPFGWSALAAEYVPALDAVLSLALLHLRFTLMMPVAEF